MGIGFKKTKSTYKYLCENIQRSFNMNKDDELIITKSDLYDGLELISFNDILTLLYIKTMWKITYQCETICTTTLARLSKSAYKKRANNYKHTMSSKQLFKLSEKELDLLRVALTWEEIFFDKKVQPYVIHKHVRYNLYDKINIDAINCKTKKYKYNSSIEPTDNLLTLGEFINPSGCFSMNGDIIIDNPQAGLLWPQDYSITNNFNGIDKSVSTFMDGLYQTKHL